MEQALPVLSGIAIGLLTRRRSPATATRWRALSRQRARG